MIIKFELQQEIITLEAIFEAMPVAMALLDREGRHVAFNQELSSFTGLGKDELVGLKVEEFSKESAENIKRDFNFFDAGRCVPDHEVRIGDRIYLVSAKPVRNSSGYAVGELVALTDITKNKETECELSEANRQLQYLANHDSLTGILNARSYYEVCDHMMNIAHRNKEPFAVLFIDIDHFKRINDTYNHETGDFVLKEVTVCIAQNMRKCDVLGRVGGEEFSVYLPNTGNEGAMVLAENLRLKIEQLMPNINGASYRVTTSIGVASSLGHHKGIADIQRDADHAMYHAKREGRNRVSCLNRPCYIEQEMTEYSD